MKGREIKTKSLKFRTHIFQHVDLFQATTCHLLTQELHPLIMAEAEIVVSDGSQRKSSRQESDMGKLDSDGFFELGQLLQRLDLLDPVSVAVGLLLLQRMAGQIHPNVVEMLFGKQASGEDLVGLLDARVEIDGSHQRLVAIGHGVLEVRVVAQVRPVGVQHKVLKAQFLGQNGEMLILDDGGSIGGQSALLQVGEHEEEVDAGEEFDDGVAQILEPLVVHNVGEFLLLLPHFRHDVDERVDAPLARIDEMDAAIAVVGLPNAAVGQGVAGVIRVRPVVDAVGGVSQRQLVFEGGRGEN